MAEADIHQVTLEWTDWRTALHLPDGLLQNMELEVARDEIGNWVTATARASILTDKFADERHQVTVWAPRTTWQMFKAQHAKSWWMRWFVRRHPVQNYPRFAEVRIQRMHWYPEARLPREKFGPFYVHEIVTSHPISRMEDS